MTQLILIVDDEPELVRPLEFAFRREGFHTRVAHDGRTALEQAAVLPRPDLVLLDLMLPDISGTEVCRRLRADADTRDIPVIMVTARGEEIDRVVGFEVGADDYVVKPFSSRELVLRARAVLRRRSGSASAPDEPVTSFGRLRVDQAGHRAWVDDKEVQLTALEFRLLTTFLERRGRVQSRDTLLETVWGMSTTVTTRTVDTHVKRLRQKLGAAGGYVQTIRGVGYRFRASPDNGRS